MMTQKFKETEIGMIPEDWEVKELGNLTTKITTGSTPPSDVRKYIDNGVNFIRSQNVFDFFIDKSKIVKVNEESIPYVQNSQVEEDDVLLNITGDGITFLRSCTLPKDILPAYTNQSIAVIRPNKSLDGKFLSYYFSLSHVKKYMEGFNAGSARRTLAAKHVKKFLIPLPSKKEQIEIAIIISSLNDKIDLNHQMNSTLEQIAQTLFKHWFIDFEFPDENGNPYRSSGGRMVDSELGEIPEGWKVGSILDFANLLSGGTPKTSVSEYWDGGVPWVSAKDVTSSNGTFILTTEKTITQKGIEKSSAKLLPKYTTAITARGTVGNICILSKEMAINQTNYGLKSKYDYGDFFLFFDVLSLIQDMKQSAYGTVFDTITTKTFRQIQIALPPIELIESFEKIVGNIMHKVLFNLEESKNLSSIRDSLLPKLMSGKIRVQI